MKPDKDVEELIAHTVDSLVMWELLVFLYNNPGITDTAAGIAGRLGRRGEDLVDPLNLLAQRNVLRAWGEGNAKVFAFDPPAKLSRAIEKFVQFHHSKEGKLRIWSQLLKKGMR